MKKLLSLLLALTMLLSLCACAKTESSGETANTSTQEPASAQEAASTDPEPSTLVYGSGDYTRINPAMDEHGEINLLIFDGLTAHDGENNVVPGLAESWDFDEETNTYTFHLRSDVTWHDGECFTANDVKFTIEAIIGPDNGSENAPNFEDVEEITVEDDYTVSFRLCAPNAAFLDYMTMAILPQHLLEGEDFQTSDFFRNPIGTGAYKLASWDVGQSIVLEKNESYFKGAANIDRIIFKIVPDDNAQAMQLESGELDLALLDPKNAQQFQGKDGFACYDLKTSDYRGILFNFWNDYWSENKDIIPAVCYAIDRQAIVDAVLLGQGLPAYGPCSGTSIIMKTSSTTTITPKRQSPFWNLPAARWARTATTSGTARKSALSSASWPANRTASISRRPPRSSFVMSASTAPSISRPRWTGADSRRA